MLGDSSREKHTKNFIDPKTNGTHDLRMNGADVDVRDEQEENDESKPLAEPPPGGTPIAGFGSSGAPRPAAKKGPRHSWTHERKEAVEPRVLASIDRCVRCGCLRRTFRVQGASIPDVTYMSRGASIWRSLRDPCVDPRQEELFGAGEEERRELEAEREESIARERPSPGAGPAAHQRYAHDVASVRSAPSMTKRSPPEPLPSPSYTQEEIDETEAWWSNVGEKSEKTWKGLFPVRVLDVGPVTVDYYVRDPEIGDAERDAERERAAEVEWRRSERERYLRSQRGMLDAMRKRSGSPAAENAGGARGAGRSTLFEKKGSRGGGKVPF